MYAINLERLAAKGYVMSARLPMELVQPFLKKLRYGSKLYHVLVYIHPALGAGSISVPIDTVFTCASEKSKEMFGNKYMPYYALGRIAWVRWSDMIVGPLQRI